MTLSNLQKLLQAQWIGNDAPFQMVSTDTRTLSPGDLFIAIQGPNFDGHDFIEDAREHGAVGAIISRSIDTPLATLKVSDTRIALGTLAKWRRSQMNIPLIGVTGSCGKTTTKTMCASILSQKMNVLATEGTLNNDYGVPITLLRLSSEHQAAVIEMGANHEGEIAYVAEIARPTVAIVTNAAPVHLEGFGDVDTVARSKGEIYQHLSSDGVAIINQDDHYASFWQKLVGTKHKVTFGIENAADVTASNIELDEKGHPSFELRTPKGKINLKLSVLGKYNIYNALAAAAATLQTGISLEQIKQGLEVMTPVPKRLNRKKGLKGAELIDDTYNANPVAFRAALQLLALEKGQKIVVMGDMRELGENALEFHAQVGREAKQYGVSKFYSVGELSHAASAAFGEGGQHFESQEALIAAIKPTLSSQMTILVKGSRGAKMENVVNALI